jgi:hypothetical protein
VPHRSGAPRSQYPKAKASKGGFPKVGNFPKVGDDAFLIQRSRKAVKQPTEKEIAGMRQRQIIRKNPHGTA